MLFLGVKVNGIYQGYWFRSWSLLEVKNTGRECRIFVEVKLIGKGHSYWHKSNLVVLVKGNIYFFGGYDYGLLGIVYKISIGVKFIW